jgi:hypothetical protein
MPITATLLWSFWDMTCSVVFGAPSPAWPAGRAGARPDHPIPGPPGMSAFAPLLVIADMHDRPRD